MGSPVDNPGSKKNPPAVSLPHSTAYVPPALKVDFTLTCDLGVTFAVPRSLLAHSRKHRRIPPLLCIKDSLRMIFIPECHFFLFLVT